MNLIDVHCHLHDTDFDKDRAEVIKRAKSAGVSKIITSTLNLVDAQKALEISTNYKGLLYIATGCDPCLLNEQEVDNIQQFIKSKTNEIVGIGEVGLDYYRVQGEEREKQKAIFISFIKLAKELNLPLIIHSRSAGKYAIKILLEENYHRVLMHAYDGKVGYILEGIKQGFYFSIPTSIVHSEQKQKLAKTLDIDRLMLESDAPVLGPVRGERNEPANLVYTVKELARIKNVPEEEVADITSRNTLRFFKLT